MQNLQFKRARRDLPRNLRHPEDNIVNVPSKPTNPRDRAWESRNLEIMQVLLLRTEVRFFQSLQSCAPASFCTPNSEKSRMQKAAVDKEWDKLKNLPPRREAKVKSRKEVIAKALKERRTVHFATLMDLCHLYCSKLDTLYSRSMVHQHHTRRPHKFWMQLPDYLDALDKEATQYPLTPKIKWKMLRLC